ncbi:MAG TPA: hypothetical protein VNA20_08035, partial [Frankiaceae bacterium]|nr:hypothetical protein [Frankiaceae bacterium]
MTSRPPAGLPPLPGVRVPVPPRGFEGAVRAAGRRRWRSLGGGAGAAETAGFACAGGGSVTGGSGSDASSSSSTNVSTS